MFDLRQQMKSGFVRMHTRRQRRRNIEIKQLESCRYELLFAQIQSHLQRNALDGGWKGWRSFGHGKFEFSFAVGRDSNRLDTFLRCRGIVETEEGLVGLDTFGGGLVKNLEGEFESVGRVESHCSRCFMCERESVRFLSSTNDGGHWNYLRFGTDLLASSEDCNMGRLKSEYFAVCGCHEEQQYCDGSLHGAE